MQSIFFYISNKNIQSSTHHTIILTQVSACILSAFGGPIGGLFLYSAFFPWATKKVGEFWDKHSLHILNLHHFGTMQSSLHIVTVILVCSTAQT